MSDSPVFSSVFIKQGFLSGLDTVKTERAINEQNEISLDIDSRTRSAIYTRRSNNPKFLDAYAWVGGITTETL